MRVFLLSLLAAAFACCASCRDTPIHGGRLTSPLDANGFMITNLPPGFFPAAPVTSVDGQTGAVSLARASLGPATNYTDAAVAAATNALARAVSNRVDAALLDLAYNGWVSYATYLASEEWGGSLSYAGGGILRDDVWSGRYYDLNMIARGGMTNTLLSVTNGIDSIAAAATNALAGRAYDFSRNRDIIRAVADLAAAHGAAVTNNPAANQGGN